jgi:hypothetical protein
MNVAVVMVVLLFSVGLVLSTPKATPFHAVPSTQDDF